MSKTRTMLSLIFVIGAAVTYASSQTTVTGTWVIHTPNADGTVQDTFLKLSQDGTAVTGSIIRSYDETKISEGSYTNGKLHITANPWSTVILTYDGVLTDDHLQLTYTTRGERNDSEPMKVTAERTSESALRPPAPLPVPALRDVPDNGLARTPPMGWNSWNHFADKIDDPTVRSIADAMVSSGMQKAGYTYINIDDTWEAGRDAAGNITTNRKFPDMKALADYVHAKGLKIGIYSSPGPKTCAGYEGSYGHEQQDAKSYAAWGIDYLKYDWCSAHAIYKDTDMPAVYQKMGQALESVGHPIVFSLCQYGRDEVWTWGAKSGGNLWRTTGDIEDTWSSMSTIGFKQAEIASYAKPGHWNDPDMLEVGNGGMSDDEYRVHMSLWCLLAAPLLAGNDLRHMSPATLAILTNSEVIAVDQDPAAHPANRTVQSGSAEVWTRSMQDGSTIVALFNRGAEAKSISPTWSDFGLTGALKARDLWKHKDLNLSGNSYTAIVPRRSVILLRVHKS